MATAFAIMKRNNGATGAPTTLLAASSSLVVVMMVTALLLVPPCTASSSTTDEECTVQADGTTACVPKKTSTSQQQCAVYMAPSTLGGDTNMGIYTGVPLKQNDIINFPEIAVPLLFREWGDHTPGYDDGTLWDRYIWEGDVMEIETYEDTDREKARAVVRTLYSWCMLLELFFF